ncbi:MAG: sulfurtransferase TusA family protein [bacterium]|nr:sulfurtransferase TusA family protein [bacterium]
MNNKKISKKVDLTGVRCPMNFVKTKLALEELEKEEFLEAVIDEGEALMNVPRSLKDEGHKIVAVDNNNNGTFTLLIEKGG